MKKLLFIILISLLPNITYACSWSGTSPFTFINIILSIILVSYFLYSSINIIKKIKKGTKWALKELLFLVFINLWVLFIINSIFQWINQWLLCS